MNWFFRVICKSWEEHAIYTMILYFGDQADRFRDNPKPVEADVRYHLKSMLLFFPKWHNRVSFKKNTQDFRAENKAHSLSWYEGVPS